MNERTKASSNEELDALALAQDRKLDLAGDPAQNLEVSPPGQPMPNVRKFIGAKYNHRDRELLVHQGGQFYAYDGKCWPPAEDAMLRAELYKWFERCWYIDDTIQKPVKKPFAPTARKVTDLFDALRGVTITETSKATPSWFVSNNTIVAANELIACENGLIHWPTRTLHSHTPNFYCHHAVPFSFDPTAPAPKKWLAFLRQLWGEDRESICCLQEIFGYLVSGGTEQQKMFLLVGPKRGGKGTIARVAAHMLGRHNVAGPTLSSLGTNFGLQDMIAKPVAIISDARLGSKSDHSLITERLLSVSGEDLQNVDRKFMAPWSGRLPTRFMILSNELPRLSDSSGALASRFVVLMLSASFYGKENPKLTEELTEEIAGIFNWALDGLRRLRERGYFEPPATSQDAIQALEDLSSPVGAFIRDRCSIGPDLNVEIKELYDQYRAWCEETGRHAVNNTVFGRDLRAVRPEIRVRQPGPDRRRHYYGIGHSRDSRVKNHCSAHEEEPACSPVTAKTSPAAASGDLTEPETEPETETETGVYVGRDQEWDQLCKNMVAPQSLNTRESREHLCAQCGAGDDGRLHRHGDVYLHVECARFWAARCRGVTHHG